MHVFYGRFRRNENLTVFNHGKTNLLCNHNLAKQTMVSSKHQLTTR